MKKQWGILFLTAVLTFSAFLMLPTRSSCAENQKELVFGMSAAFTGANSELGIEFYRGLMAYLDYLNTNGGAGGWKIRITPSNDGYNPGPCFQNTVRFIDEDIFALFSYVGTPTTTHILPLLQKFHDKHLYLLFPVTGAQPLRTPPFGQFVYNLRASYFEETAGLVDHLVGAGRERIAVFYQSDAYGRTGWDGVSRALKRHGLDIVREAAFKRGASFENDYANEVAYLLEAAPDAIICIGTYGSQGGFIRDLRTTGSDIPVAGLSFADSDKMLDLLTLEGRRTGLPLTQRLIQSQVVPSYEDTSLEAVRFYRILMDNYKGMPTLSDRSYTPRRFSYVSLEGFLNGILLGEMVKRMADDPDPARIPEVIAGIRDFDIGIGVDVNFGPNRHQGLDKVYFTTVQNGHFKPILDWEAWRK